MRSSISAVKSIIETSLSDSSVTAYLNTASALVTQALSGSTLGVDILTEIETWTAAHLIASTQERQTVKEGAGGAYVEYAGVFGDGLKSTSYGQMVLILDTTGAMASLGGKSVKITAL